MPTDQITIRVPPSLALAYRSAAPERQRKMELYMTLRLKEYEDGSDVSFEEAWARLGDQAESRGLTEQKMAHLLKEISDERGNGGPQLGDGYGCVS